MRNIRQIKNLKGKKVLIRIDFNVPIKNGKVLDDFRIRKALPTIKYLEKKGAKIILITHLGKDGSESLEPVIKRFFQISKCSTKQISFFENVRKFDGEMKNKPNFAKKLAKLGDIYVNEAFSVSHRKHASLVSLPKLLPSFAGLGLKEEINNLSKIIKNPKKPFLLILGGSKFSTKLPLIKKYIKSANFIYLGGALANNFIKAKGCEIGGSLIDKNFSSKGLLKNKNISIPVDVLVFSQNKLINKKLEDIKKGEIILDIGSGSVKELFSLIKRSNLILWNGPLGKYEDKGDGATKKTMNFLLKNKLRKEIILGGGDLVSLVPNKFLKSKNNKNKSNLFISTGGGATLEFLTKGTLPAIDALS